MRATNARPIAVVAESVGLWLRVHYATKWTRTRLVELETERRNIWQSCSELNRWHIELIAAQLVKKKREHNKFNSIPIRLLSMWRERIRHVVSNWNTVDTVGKYFSVRQKDDGEFLSICVCVLRVRVAPGPLCVVAKAAAEANFKIRQQCRQQAITAENSAELRLEQCTLCASERKRKRESAQGAGANICCAVSLSTSRHNWDALHFIFTPRHR